MHKTLFLSLFALTLFLGCTKKKKDTSPYTSSEYFTCLVNGEEWVASTPNNPNGPPDVEAHYYPEYDQLNISGCLKDQNYAPTVYQSIYLRIIHPGSINEAEVKVGDGNIVGYSDLLSNYCNVRYYDSICSYSCHITKWNIDTREVEGTFEIELLNSSCEDTIMTISNGQFSAYF